ncbi:pyrophosphatase PpaX [Effusibacillus lacus]|uniref:Pyrophosphatase n=1 Tax=Effusibacillus lacus TaxID=1348429 RepID=A0A292YQP7_9BACL|nr:pyrophosphatase PpaX [Effusibacillus lacus]TCS74193.1 pyrophosphatase PpaX [Effusibacillus lacus]GAX90810.1 pyrophosphatase [Effusibacillus lacus]
MKYPYILFDLDGTLIDTNELILQSFEHTLELFFPGRFTRQDVLPYMGEPLVTQFSRWASAEQVPLLVDTYRKFNVENHDRLVTIFPNVLESITELKQQGCKMAVVTSKMRLTAMMGLRLFGLDRFMDTVITIEDTDKHKPDPAPLLLAMDQLEADPGRTLMVGDSPFDILGGQAAGTSTCGVAWSLRGPEGLAPYNPKYLIDDMRELLSILRR